jgi:hypothetical protein
MLRSRRRGGQRPTVSAAVPTAATTIAFPCIVRQSELRAPPVMLYQYTERKDLWVSVDRGRKP